MFDIHTATRFTDGQQREFELRAQRQQMLIEARVSSETRSPFRGALSVIPAAARGAVHAGRMAASRSH